VSLSSISLRRCLLPVLVASTCFHVSGSYAFEGQVLDLSTGKPIPDAVVVVLWYGSSASIPESHFGCANVETAMTNAEGRYQIENWLGSWYAEYLLRSGKEVDYGAYKFGYKSVLNPLPTQKRIYLQPFTGSKDEWLDSVHAGAFQCHTTTYADSANLYLLYAKVATDAEAMAETTMQRDKASRIRSVADDYRPFAKGSKGGK
jgi:hypothetical protein